jgi:hypothetical protein
MLYDAKILKKREKGFLFPQKNNKWGGGGCFVIPPLKSK